VKFGRSEPQKPKSLAMPERTQTVTVVPARGKGLPARVLESGEDGLLVAIMVPIEPLDSGQLDGLVVEFVAAQGRVRLTGTTTIENPAEPDVLRLTEPRPLEVLQEREYVRIQSSRPVLIYGGPDKMPIQSYTVDISGGGFLVAGPDLLKLGEEIQFKLTLTQGTLEISGTGTVRRVDAQGRRGIEFASISEADRRSLIHFIFECQRAERQRGLQPGGGYGS
jgi:PilZ domain